MGVYLFVHYRGSAEAIRDGYARTADQLTATPGLLGTELLCDPADRHTWTLLMRWTDIDSFHSWEHRLRAQGHPSHLRSYQDRARPGGHYEVFAT
ncbi:antibiotic biosynthesis monooxygenase family protein [Streptosporangium sp. CA-135522]|uniref:antibiotic biosynthesis monooxygenase family protein n=1 Tax=Streptosporangium sp. CA-135522 TaxID=3240072 RepID=UPI003D922141